MAKLQAPPSNTVTRFIMEHLFKELDRIHKDPKTPLHKRLIAHHILGKGEPFNLTPEDMKMIKKAVREHKVRDLDTSKPGLDFGKDFERRFGLQNTAQEYGISSDTLTNLMSYVDVAPTPIALGLGKFLMSKDQRRVYDYYKFYPDLYKDDPSVIHPSTSSMIGSVLAGGSDILRNLALRTGTPFKVFGAE